MKTLQKIALALVIIGAINWGLIGFFRFDLVASLFGGQGAFLSRVIYSLVGLSGLVCLALLFKDWEESDYTVESRPRKTYQKPSYGTEFGKETDMSELKKQAKKDMDRDNWMSAEEAKEYGIIDEIITK